MKPLRSRVHFLAAKSAPTIVVIQRKRAKLFHILTVDALTHEFQEGSWFGGKLYALRCDVSPDGKFMVYFAMGAGGQIWNGVCRLPWLKCLVEAGQNDTWSGGGFFERDQALKTFGWDQEAFRILEEVPFTIERDLSNRSGDRGVLYAKLERDGFRRLGDSWGHDLPSRGPGFQVPHEGDDGWGRKFSENHPELKLKYIGYLGHGYKFQFSVDSNPDLLREAEWANWDSVGNLWVARPGLIEKYSLEDLKNKRPGFSLDLEPLEPPVDP